MADETLQLRCGEQVFAPVTLEQIKTLMAADKIEDGDCVREGEGPWVLVREYLAWKDQAKDRVSDIAALLGGVNPVSQETPTTPKQELPPLSDDEPLSAPAGSTPADSEPAAPTSVAPTASGQQNALPDEDEDALPTLVTPTPGEDIPLLPLADEPMVLDADQQQPSRTQSGGKPSASAASASNKPKQKPAVSLAKKPKAAESKKRQQPASSKSAQRKATASSASSRDSVTRVARPKSATAIIVDGPGDLDAVLRAMAEYEQKAPAITVQAGKSSGSVSGSRRATKSSAQQRAARPPSEGRPQNRRTRN